MLLIELAPPRSEAASKRRTGRFIWKIDIDGTYAIRRDPS
jgi:hypothetical protein